MSRREKVTRVIDYNAFTTNCRKNIVYMKGVPYCGRYIQHAYSLLKRMIKNRIVMINITGFKGEEDVWADVELNGEFFNRKIADLYYEREFSSEGYVENPGPIAPFPGWGITHDYSK